MTKSLPTLPQPPRQSLVESTLGLIRQQIETGVWKVGERIPRESELAEMLQVGRNTVREAIRVLSHAQVLEVRQGNGTYVRSSVDPGEIMKRVSQSQLVDHLELRAILETEAARLAAMRRSEEDLATLSRLLEERGDIPEDGDLSAFVERDVAFHMAVAHASHNTALEELYRYFSASVQIGTHIILAAQKVPEPGAAAHARIFEAIRRGDAEEATEAARAVVESLLPKNQGPDADH